MPGELTCVALGLTHRGSAGGVAKICNVVIPQYQVPGSKLGRDIVLEQKALQNRVLPLLGFDPRTLGFEVCL